MAKHTNAPSTERTQSICMFSALYVPSIGGVEIASALHIAIGRRQALQAQGLAVAKRVRDICSWQQTAKRTLGACDRANMGTSRLAA